jgi:hypothetical protein
MAHTSQISLSRSRLLRWASEPESFEPADPSGSNMVATAAEIVLHIPLVPSHRFWRRHDVLLVLVDGNRIERARVRLPRLVGADARQILGERLCSGRVRVELVNGMVQITIASGATGTTSGYVKLDRSPPRLLIFDDDTWRRFEDFSTSRESVATRIEPVAAA